MQGRVTGPDSGVHLLDQSTPDNNLDWGLKGTHKLHSKLEAEALNLSVRDCTENNAFSALSMPANEGSVGPFIQFAMVTRGGKGRT